MKVLLVTTEVAAEFISDMDVDQTADNGPMTVHVGKYRPVDLGEVVAISSAVGLGFLIFERSSENLYDWCDGKDWVDGVHVLDKVLDAQAA